MKIGKSRRYKSVFKTTDDKIIIILKLLLQKDKAIILLNMLLNRVRLWARIKAPRFSLVYGRCLLGLCFAA